MSADEPPLAPCVADAPRAYTLPLPALNDPEGARLPASLPRVIDAHVHLFPDKMFAAIWQWFEAYGWPIRYKLHTPAVIQFLLARGVHRIVALHYAHKPGIARGLNRYMAGVCANEPRVTGLATVMPGEPDAMGILEEAFAAGLSGVKLHCHVQCVAADSDAARAVYAACERADKPVVIHAGREPSSAHYACDTRALCAVERVERVLQDHPRLKLCVPHLGADEYDGYARLLARYDNLWLDTTVAVAGYIDDAAPWHLLALRPERVMYGTDFPSLPYAWDREIGRIVARAGLSDDALERVLGKTAGEFYGATDAPRSDV